MSDRSLKQRAAMFPTRDFRAKSVLLSGTLASQTCKGDDLHALALQTITSLWMYSDMFGEFFHVTSGERSRTRAHAFAWLASDVCAASSSGRFSRGIENISWTC